MQRYVYNKLQWWQEIGAMEVMVSCCRSIQLSTRVFGPRVLCLLYLMAGATLTAVGVMDQRCMVEQEQGYGCECLITGLGLGNDC